MDLCFAVSSNQKFNFRVAAVIEWQDSILLQEFDGTDFLTLPGGRVIFGENTQDALLRELQEELGVSVESIENVFFAENFFEWSEKRFHEISVIYRVTLSPVDAEKLEGHRAEGSRFFWLKKSDLQRVNLKPQFLKDELLKKQTVFRQIFNIDQ